MATSKKTTQHRTVGKGKATPGTPRRMNKNTDDTLRTNDVVAEQARAANGLAAAIPFNAAKELEYGHDNVLSPPAGVAVEPASAALTASTQSEKNGTAKTGGAVMSGGNATIASLDRVRVDGGGQALTTNQGVRIADNQNSLKAGLRGPTLLEDFILREKITHFDHERIPERIVHAFSKPMIR